MSFLKECREAARNCPDANLSAAMREAADHLSEMIDIFALRKDPEALSNVNGAWALCVRVLKRVTAPPTIPGGSSIALDKVARAA